MPTFSKRATLIRDTERLLKLIILYNDDDDSDDVEKKWEYGVILPVLDKKRREFISQVNDFSTNPQVDTM